MTSQPPVRRRRLARVAVAGLVVAVCATACGLSNTAKSTISQGGTGTATSGGVRTAAQGGSGSGGVATAQQQASSGDPAVDGSGGAAVDGGSGDTSTVGDGSVAGDGAATTDPSATGGDANVATGNGVTTPVTGSGSGNAAPVAGGAPTSGSTGSKSGATTPTTGATKPGATKSTAPASGGKTTAPTGGGKTTAPAKGSAPTSGGKNTAPAADGSGGGGGGNGGGTPPSTAASCNTAGGDATGVTDTDINIGLHAPLTGTGTPFDNSSFDEGSKIFWKYKGADNKIAHQVCGRNVQLDFEDDTYKPTGAQDKCTAFATTKFLVLGGAGTDQIQACATDTEMDSNNVPYLSAGVTENGLTGLSNYFAISLTYRQQGGLVVKTAQANGFDKPAPSADGKQWAIVTASSPNFDDATKGITDALDAAGISYTVFRQDQSGSYQNAATQLGVSLAAKNYKTIYTLAAPGYWLYVTTGYYTQSPTGNGVKWTGPGVSFTDYLLAQLVCKGSKNMINNAAYYLAPNKGLDQATDEFRAAAKQDGQAGDDIQWGLYGLDQGVYALMQNAAQNGLTRQSFLTTTKTQSVNVNPAYAPLAFNGHFGGTGAYTQKIDCTITEPGQQQVGSWTTASGLLIP